MAPKKMPARSGVKKIPTYDTNPEQLFGLWQEAGRIPPQYRSWDDLKVAFMSKIQEGMAAPQARAAVGVTYKNIIGNPILNVEKNKDTGQIEFAEGGMRRAIREDFNIAEENQIRRTHGEAEVQRFRAELQNDWNNLSEGERVAIQKQYHKQFHRGHVKGAKTGGSIARENMWPEHGMRNSLHGALPRWPAQVMEQLGVPQDWVSSYYEKVLASEGMPAAPRISDELAMAADERMVQPVSGMPSNIKGQTQWASDLPKDVRGKKWQPDLTGEAGIDPNTLEMRAWKQKDVIAQVGEEAVAAHQANLSSTMSRGTATAQSGPVKIVQPKGPTVTTKGVPKGLMPDRKALRAMAAAGLVAPSVLGTAASATETAGRVQLARQTGNPVDWIQAGIAGASSAGDVAGYTGIGAIPGEIVSTVADLANVAIDTARAPSPRPAYIPNAQARPRTASAARTQGQTMPKVKPIDIENELRWLGKAGQRAFQSIFGGREI